MIQRHQRRRVKAKTLSFSRKARKDAILSRKAAKTQRDLTAVNAEMFNINIKPPSSAEMLMGSIF